MFDGMDVAQGSNSGIFFTDGVYSVELKEIEYRPNGYKGKSVIFRFKVLTSNNSEHAPQSTRTWILKLGKKPDEDKRTMADIKSLIFALTGTSAREVGTPEQNPEAHKQATAAFLAAIDRKYAEKYNLDPEMLLGAQCNLECLGIKTKPKPGQTEGTVYTRHNWSPLEG